VERSQWKTIRLVTQKAPRLLKAEISPRGRKQRKGGKNVQLAESQAGCLEVLEHWRTGGGGTFAPSRKQPADEGTQGQWFLSDDSSNRRRDASSLHAAEEENIAKERPVAARPVRWFPLECYPT